MSQSGSLRITVRDSTGADGVRPVTGGVPIARGSAPEGTVFTLQDNRGRHVPLQTAVIAQWPDGSVRWVLLDFQSKLPPLGEEKYLLSWGDEAVDIAVADPIRPATGEACRKGNIDELSLQSGTVSVSCPADGLLDISDCLRVSLHVIDAAGNICPAVPRTSEIETLGPLRTTLAIGGDFLNSSGDRLFQFRLRVSIFAGLTRIRLEPALIVDCDTGIVQQIRGLNLAVRPVGTSASCRLGGDPGWSGSPGSAVRVFQRDDRNYEVQGTDTAGRRAPGWAELTHARGVVALALRDFWQQWPKSLECTAGGLEVGLFPLFTAGDFEHVEPWWKYDYLFSGNCYRLRTGQARRWDVWLDSAGEGESLAGVANAPLVPIPDPAQAIATGVWDTILPAGAEGMAHYDEWAESLFDQYRASTETARDYGAMNWGDWYGERVVNWGNNEYDTPNLGLIQYARTGDLKYFYAADAGTRHMVEVDTVHHVNAELGEYFRRNWPEYAKYPPRSGMVHMHTIGHVGGFHSEDAIGQITLEKCGIWHPYICMDPFHLCHCWTQGTARLYFLTGDPFLRETVEMIADNISQLVEDCEYEFMGHTHCGRTTGWSMLALAGAVEMTGNERYLRALRTLADEALDAQDPCCGGWLIHPMAPDHCKCTTARHTGMAGFITSVLINGLSRYYLLSGDDRIPAAVDAAVTFLNNDTWREEWQDWRYTSCPASHPINQIGVTLMALVSNVRINGNAEHLRILRIAWSAKFRRLQETPLEGAKTPFRGLGKLFSVSMYAAAESAALLADAGAASSSAREVMTCGSSTTV